MFEPDILNYFLVLLGGFGVVWSFRRTLKQHDEKISEFEYAAFSTLWGIPVFFVFAEALKSRPDLLNSAFALPMSATPTLFLLGVVLGYIGAQVVRLFLLLRQVFQSRKQ